MGADGTECMVVNVYASCFLKEKMELRDRLHSVLSNLAENCICVVGDFNSIRRESERVGRSEQGYGRDIMVFDCFIRGEGLINLPLIGRKFTCYKPDGSCKSRIDRFLINDGWLTKWLNSTQRGLRRSILDHCPLLLEIKVKD